MDTYDQILADISAVLRQYNKTYPQLTAEQAVSRIQAIIKDTAYTSGYLAGIQYALDRAHHHLEHLDPSKNTED